MPHSAHRPWVPAACETRVQDIATTTADATSDATAARIDALIAQNLQIHDRDCFNLNPATNVMNPRAEAALAQGLGSRPSLGYPGDKYEMGLEAIEEIEVIAAELACEIFDAKYALTRPIKCSRLLGSLPSTTGMTSRFHGLGSTGQFTSRNGPGYWL